MAKGIIYTMTTIVPGLIKIGKTKNFESRMYTLEHNGYCNVTGLQRSFAIEVEDYEEKEQLLHTIFEKSMVGDTELFSLNINIANQLLSSFDGKQIYPENKTKEEVFEESEDSLDEGEVASPYIIPDGIYTMSRKIKSLGRSLKATLQVKNGKMYVLAGSEVSPDVVSKSALSMRKAASIKAGKLTKNYPVNSPSAAAILINGMNSNGWVCWKTKSGESIDIFRTKTEQTLESSAQWDLLQQFDEQDVEEVTDCAGIEPIELIPEDILPQKEESDDKNQNKKKAAPFSFEEVGIPVGAEIVFVDDENIRPVVYDAKHVIWNGEIWSLSKLAQTIRKTKYPQQGPVCFTYKGKKLSEMREENTKKEGKE